MLDGVQLSIGDTVYVLGIGYGSVYSGPIVHCTA